MISVLLPYRDAEATLAEALAGICSDLEAGDELVAIDDGSRDRSAQIARAQGDSRVVHVASGGGGIAHALTCGLAAARGDLIARMDADDVSLPGRLQASRALLGDQASLGAAAVQVDLFGAPGPGVSRYVAWQNGLVTPGDHARAIFVESPLCHPATTIRRTALEAVGGFREAPWAEDYDLWHRLHAAGWGLAKTPRVLFRWRIHPRSLTWTDPRYAPVQHRDARAHYLAALLEHKTVRSFGIWGAGKTGKLLARALEAHRWRPSFFVDIDPRKIDGLARGAPIVDPERGLARLASESAFLVVAVGAEGARDIVRERLARAGLVEGDAFVCAA